MTNKLALAAHEVSRTNHTSHATCIPRKRPKAACAYRYGPPVWAKREDTSQKQAMMTPMASAATMTANMLARPSSPESIEGSPKTPLPIMQFTISAAILQRPMARTRPSLEVCGGLISGTRVCITNYGAYGNGLSGARFHAVTFARTKVTHRITKAHARGTSTRLTLPMRWLSGKPMAFEDMDDLHLRIERVTDDLRTIQQELNCAAMAAPSDPELMEADRKSVV